MLFHRVAALSLIALVAAVLTAQPYRGYAMIQYDKSPPGPFARFDNACAQVATILTMGMHSVQEAEWIADCGKHPKREVCESTKKFLADLPTQPVSELICEAGADAPGRAIQSGPASAPTHRPAPQATPRAPSKDDRPDPNLAASPILAPERARWDDACAMWATWKTLGLIDPTMPQLLADCQNHPDQDVCRNTKKFVEESTSQPVTDLICRKGK